jgi:hypothetical protein
VFSGSVISRQGARWEGGVDANFEAEQHLLFVGEITDHTAQRRRELLDERRRREDSVVLGALGMLEDVDDLELIPTVQLLLADALQVRDRLLRAGAGSGDVELEDVRRTLPSERARNVSARCAARQGQRMTG